MAKLRFVHAAVLASGTTAMDGDVFNLPSSPIAWQAHSFNDLRTWRQLPSKSFGRVLSVKLDPHAVDADGLFKLTHDEPVSGIAYNTTDDVLDASDGLLADWPELLLRVALCFKGGFDPCDQSTYSNTWLVAVDRFFGMAEHVRAKFPGRLEFVLDGIAKPFDCLHDRWRPWVATWIPDDHSPDSALFTNNETIGEDRYQILNLKDSPALWQTYGELSFGKFGKGNYPLQLWEPDHQTKIQNYSDWFLAEWLPQSPDLEFDFAINMDPKMWEVFSAAETKRAWNEALPLSGQRFAPRLFRSSSGDLLMLSANGQDVSWDLFGSDATFGSLSLLGSGTLQLGSVVSAACLSADNSLHVVTVGGEYVTFALTQENTLEEIDRVVAPLALALHGLADGSVAALLLLSSDSSEATMGVNVLTAGADGPQLWALPPFVGELASAALAAMPDGSFLAAASNGSHAFAASSAGGGWALVGAGKALSLALLDRPDAEAVVALVADGGFCAVSHPHNTDATVKVCDRAIDPCDTALDYTIGTASQWADLIAGASGPAGPCTALLRGTYDFGSAPSVALEDLGGGAVALLALHEGLSARDELKTRLCECGLALARPGELILDGFPLRVSSAKLV